MLFESAMLGFVGSVIGLGLAYGALRFWSLLRRKGFRALTRSASTFRCCFLLWGWRCLLAC